MGPSDRYREKLRPKKGPIWSPTRAHGSNFDKSTLPDKEKPSLWRVQSAVREVPDEKSNHVGQLAGHIAKGRRDWPFSRRTQVTISPTHFRTKSHPFSHGKIPRRRLRTLKKDVGYNLSHLLFVLVGHKCPRYIYIMRDLIFPKVHVVWPIF